jgi:hypothetical protein
VAIEAWPDGKVPGGKGQLCDHTARCEEQHVYFW